MSEPEISALLDAEPASRARKLIPLFDETPEDEGKIRVVRLLYDIGDEEITRNFYAELLQRTELSPRLKSCVTLRDGMYKCVKRARELGLKIASDERPRPKKPAKILAFERPVDK